MTSASQTATGVDRPCLVLMFKAPARSKRRIAEQIGRRAEALAEQLFACAAEDLRAWPGTVCYAPAEAADADWLAGADLPAGRIVPQGAGNLGERINRVNRALLDRRQSPQFFIGIDCPELTPDYLADAMARLADCDVVLGPATDGGVVLMGTRTAWPELGHLPWSASALGAALAAVCTRSGANVAQLGRVLNDVDSVADLERACAALAADARPARRSLCSWCRDLAAMSARQA